MATARYTKEQRQEIVRDFAVRHNGQYNPKLFLQEVRKVGESHPAYGWFEWNSDKAAQEYQLWQAREFAHDLKVSFSVETVGRKGAVKVVQTEMPMVLSPRESRKDGGGYVLSNPSDQDHMAEHCHQAAVALRTWVNRYQAALIHAGVTGDKVEDIAALLENVNPAGLIAAE
jgi:hypothetical protein